MSLRNSWDAIDAPRATTPPPPLYQRRKPQDRSSISSVLTTSTTASSIIVSPTTPTKQEWAPVRIASPTLGKGREWQGRDSWGSMSEDENLGTPRSGSFLDVKVPQTSKGSHAESQSWWAGVSLGVFFYVVFIFNSSSYSDASDTETMLISDHTDCTGARTWTEGY